MTKAPAPLSRHLARRRLGLARPPALSRWRDLFPNEPPTTEGLTVPETNPRTICSRCRDVIVDGATFTLSVERTPADGRRSDPARLCQGCAGQLVDWLRSDRLRFERAYEFLPRREPAGA